MADYLTQEDTDKILLETGFGILLEQQPPPPEYGQRVSKFHRSMSGYNLFVRIYVKYRLNGLSPIKTPDGQLL